MLESFISSLKEHIQNIVLRSKPNSIQEASDLALLIEEQGVIQTTKSYSYKPYVAKIYSIARNGKFFGNSYKQEGPKIIVATKHPATPMFRRLSKEEKKEDPRVCVIIVMRNT